MKLDFGEAAITAVVVNGGIGLDNIGGLSSSCDRSELSA
jgi:hypothetical protein